MNVLPGVLDETTALDDHQAKSVSLCYTSSFEAVEVKRRLEGLLAGGEISDPDLDRRLEKLDERFRVCVTTYPYGLWAPGLVPCSEMGRMIELYLPMVEILCAFRRLFTLALRTPRVLPAHLFEVPANWFDCLAVLDPDFRRANPGALLRSLMRDEAFRIRFVFGAFLPGRHGGGFDRYPGQAAFVRSWLYENRSRLDGNVRCLDAACGTGEGTYGLALLLSEGGFCPERMVVHGSTLEPVELFAAAHGYFPCDAGREDAYRRRIQPLIATGAATRLFFYQEDLCLSESGATGYDLILCNGLLGGPALHDPKAIASVVRKLAGRLRPEGVLLAADRFHDGWKKSVPREVLRDIFVAEGLRLLPVVEGVAGMKPGREG